MSRGRHLVRFILVVAFLALALPADAAKSYSAERFHVRMQVQADGSVLVTESIRFVFGPDTFTYVYREIPERRTDGITYVAATMDGVAMPRGSQPGAFEVRKADGGRRRVVWRFPALTSSAHTFTLTYSAVGVVRQDSDADVLAWTLLPTKHEYPIDCASGEIEYPATTALAGPAAFDLPASDAQSEKGVERFLRCPFGKDEAWVVTLRFAPKTLAAVAPAWQQRQWRTRDSAPLFLGLAGLILLVGVGGFVFFRLNQRLDFQPDRERRLPDPPDASPVCLGAVLSRNGVSVGWPPVLGALLDLARRGVVRVEETSGYQLFKTRHFVVHLVSRPPALVRHEGTLLDLLFTTRSGPRPSVKLSEIGRIFASKSRWKRLRAAVMDDLRAAGLVDPERERTRSRVTILSVAIVAAGAIGLPVSAALMERTGDAVLVMPAAVLIAGFAGIATGASLSPLTDEGRRRGELWKAYGRHLRDTSKQGPAGSMTSEAFERVLPYAAAFGVAVAWAKQLEKQGYSGGPSWLQTLARDGNVNHGHMAATIAMLSAGASAGAHAGGGGAAGGGASGAG